MKTIEDVERLKDTLEGGGISSEWLEAIDKKIGQIEEKMERKKDLMEDLKYSLEIQKIIPDAFEHGSVEEIRWTKVKRTQVSNKYPRMGWVYAGVLTRGDGSTREIPFATLKPRPDDPSFIQLKKKHLMDSGYTIKI